MRKENNRFCKFDNVLKFITRLCFAFILLTIIAGGIVSPDLRLFREEAKVYDREWVKENADGSTEAFTMPTSLNLAKDEYVTLKTTLPDQIEDGTHLAITTGKCYKAYIDDEEIYSFDNSISKLPGMITKPITVPIPLKASYSGKQLTMVITDGKYERGMVRTAYIGTMMGILFQIIKGSVLQFSLAILLVITSLITIGIFTCVEISNKRKVPLIYLAAGILCISSWIIFNSYLFQIAFRGYFFDGIVGYMLVITMAVPFFLYFDEILEKRYHVIFVIGETLSILNFIVLTFLHMTNILSYYTVLVYIDSILAVYIVVMIVCTLIDYFIRKEKNHQFVLIGLVGLSLCSILEIIVTISNSKMPFKVDVSGIAVAAGMIILLLFATFDQVKVLDAQKQETQNAIAATKAKSDFLANMSHEIRTPINAIMGMNEMVLQESNQDSVKEYAKDISSASENLLRIVNDILDFSKIESGKLEIINDNYDLGEIIYDVTTLVNMKAENKGLKLSVIVDENLPSKLYGDDKRVRGIITNILNNAVKYTERGFVNLIIGGVVKENIVELNIRVEDSGQGIKEEDLDKIFSGFSQVNVKQNKNIEGTGLGLSITKRLVELMDGSITVESEFGKGSVFTVILPQQVVSFDKMGNYMSHRHVSSENTATEKKEIEIPDAKILVVDDTPLNLKVISKFLAKTKAEVVCVPSGEEMLKLVQENRYDIILLDHMMPNMDGIETLKAAKALPNNMCENVPVIALTANAVVGAREMYLEAGFNDYLSKPVRIETLFEMIIKYLPSEMVR